MSTNEYNNYPPHYKGLEISKVLREQNIITFFAIDTRTNSIVIEFNHTYQPKTKKVIGPIDLQQLDQVL